MVVTHSKHTYNGEINEGHIIGPNLVLPKLVTVLWNWLLISFLILDTTHSSFSTVLEIWKLSFVETSPGHVSYISTSETQYIVLIESGCLVSKLTLLFRDIQQQKQRKSQAALPIHNLCAWDVAIHPGSLLKESCPLTRCTDMPEWLSKVMMFRALKLERWT